MLLLVFIAVTGALSLTVAWTTMPSGAYIHIPFCRRRCYYCDFPIKVVGDGSRAAETEAYTEVLLREIAYATAPDTSGYDISKGEGGVGLDTVYFGGGTPSLLHPEQVGRILSALDTNIGISKSAEVTLEMDPGTFTRETVVALRQSGVNRVSLGVQSFDNEVLEKCGRAHRAEDVHRALDDLHAAGIDNVSIDLIASLPYVSPTLWEQTLEKAVATGCPHLSVYDLQVEDKTAFGRWYTPGQFPLPSDECSAAMYTRAVEVLSSQQGQGQGLYEHYEVSNYAKPGYRSRHNQKYWECAATWGFGMGAASYVAGVRVTRPVALPAYTQWVDSLGSSSSSLSYKHAVAGLVHSGDGSDDETSPGGPTDSSGSGSGSRDDFDDDDDSLEVIMLALRTADGLDLASLASRFGPVAVDRVLGGLDEYIRLGLVLTTTSSTTPSPSTFAASTSIPAQGDTGAAEAGVVVRLKDPEGFLVSNDIIASVFARFLDD